MFKTKDFEQLYSYKIVHQDMIEVHNNYFFCYEKCILFIKKSRKYYKVMGSAACGFEPTFRESVFDCLYYSENIDESIQMFKSYVERLLCRALIL